MPFLKIKRANENNLNGFDIEIPLQKLVAITGISGSGKSSLAFDIIAKEGQRRYLETLPSFARQFSGKYSRPLADKIDNLPVTIAVGQKTFGNNPRSTVGTLTDIYDLLRLLFARFGLSTHNIPLSRTLFSFNSKVGQCEQCKGIGKEETIDIQKVVIHPEKTIRNGALAPTLPSGYIMYSQVTMDSLNLVCKAEGFDIDKTWNELNESQKKVILYGSKKIKVPFGKHSLESRLKWTGIKIKPRENEYYKGLITIMNDILNRDRNANILKYVTAIDCQKCNGDKLNEAALKVKIEGRNIAELNNLSILQLFNWVNEHKLNPDAAEIKEELLYKMELIIDLGLGHLKIGQTATNLSQSELQRIKISNQLSSKLSNILYVFDEPTIGLNKHQKERLLNHFRRLKNNGNSILIVDHDLTTIKAVDWIIDMGIGAGTDGGNILFNGRLKEFLNSSIESYTLKALKENFNENENDNKKQKHNKKVALNFENKEYKLNIGEINIITGLTSKEQKSITTILLNKNNFQKHIYIDQTPIGRTPRSNPATYTGLSELIRDLFSQLTESKQNKFSKSKFSFNTKGGRCETCLGAGKIQLGLHYLGNIDLLCESCNGDRFKKEVLNIKYQGYSIAEIYNHSVTDAITLFKDQPKIIHILQLMKKLGLGYLKLGQSSTTLSGGEAQRIKLTKELQSKHSSNALFIIDHPTIGLHPYDINNLINTFNHIALKENTVLCFDQNEIGRAHV